MRTFCFTALIVLLCAIPPSLHAQDAGTDVVYLKNGSIIRGTIVELVPDSSVKIRTRDGSVFVYEMNRIKKIEKDAPAEKKSQYNPYSLHKQIAGWGLAGSMAATFVGSLAMNDEYFATTVLPVVGPFVTIIRIENDPTAFYRPGGRTLLFASGILQTGFLIYLTSAWIGERSHDARFSVMPASNATGIKLRYRF